MKDKVHASQIGKVKSEIIVAVLDYSEDGDNKYKTEAIQRIKIFAKFYNIPLSRKDTVQDLKKSLRQFILNYKGYQFTIQNLYNSLVDD